MTSLSYLFFHSVVFLKHHGGRNSSDALLKFLGVRKTLFENHQLRLLVTVQKSLYDFCMNKMLKTKRVKMRVNQCFM